MEEVEGGEMAMWRKISPNGSATFGRSILPHPLVVFLCRSELVPAVVTLPAIHSLASLTNWSKNSVCVATVMTSAQPSMRHTTGLFVAEKLYRPTRRLSYTRDSSPVTVL